MTCGRSARPGWPTRVDRLAPFHLVRADGVRASASVGKALADAEGAGAMLRRPYGGALVKG
jgi:hypothetical protein